MLFPSKDSEINSLDESPSNGVEASKQQAVHFEEEKEEGKKASSLTETFNNPDEKDRKCKLKAE